MIMAKHHRHPELSGDVMWRSFFVALGAFALLLGLQCMFIEQAKWSSDGGILIPPDWAPWSLISTGAVVMLYSFTLPKKLSS
jgi:hypothetical protein